MNNTTTAVRRRWAYSLIHRVSPPPPSYGSAEWLTLAEGSAEKVASVVTAAECWAQGADTFEDDLRREVDATRRADDDLYAELHQDAQRLVASIPRRPNYRERRRRELAEARPGPGDYPGRSGDGAE